MAGEEKGPRAGRQAETGCYGRIFDEAAFGRRGSVVTPTDVAVALCALALAGLAWAALWFGWFAGAATTQGEGGGAGVLDAGASDGAAGGLVAVVQNSEGYRAELPLGADVVLTVEGSLGSNTVEVSQGRVRCSAADCSNQVCVQTGWVFSDGQMIVCLPHELTVQVVSDPARAVPLV